MGDKKHNKFKGIPMTLLDTHFHAEMSLPEFLASYGTEAQCFEALYQWRWPEGFVCPACDSKAFCQLTTRKLLECYSCRRQTSITAGTPLASTKMPLKTWFLGLYYLKQS